MQKRKQAFTLVELIVVIIILAILGTIAFITLQGYSAQARDSKRLSDISNIKKSVELFSLNTGKYPEPDDYFTVSYGGQELRYQGTVGNQVSTNLSRNLNEKPTDPLTLSEYTYSRTYVGAEYEVLSIYESDLIVTSPQSFPTGEGARPLVVSSSFAVNANYPKINGNYNGVYVKAGNTYIPTPSIINGNIWGNIDLEVNTTALESQVITGGDNLIAYAGNEASTGGLVGMTVEMFSGTLDTDRGEDDNGNKVILAQAFIDAYSGTILANYGVYKEIIETSSEDLISLVDTFVLNNDNFVNTTSSDDGGGGSTPPEEPTVLITESYCTGAGWFWVDSDTDTIGDGFCISPRIEGISWGDIGTYYSWTRTSSNLIATNGDNLTSAYSYASNAYGVTYDLGNYICKSLGTATIDFDTVNGEGDTIYNRMIWLVNNKTNSTALDDIDWVTVPDKPSTFSVPALMLSDCIDGERDLSGDNVYEGVTFTEYSTPAANAGTTRIKMNKYLLGWSKDSGSHLPSAFSNISSEVTDYLTINKGEYQIACENNILIGGDFTTDDDNNNRILLSAVGDTTGAYWGRNARTFGGNGCEDQAISNIGDINSLKSARFVIRP